MSGFVFPRDSILFCYCKECGKRIVKGDICQKCAEKEQEACEIEGVAL